MEELRLISNNHDENGKLAGGKVGDQTGYEFVIKKYYDGDWDLCLRYEGPRAEEARALASRIGCILAADDKVGYDTSNKLALSKALKKAGYDPFRIENTEGTCSSSINAIWITVGQLLDIPQLKLLRPGVMTAHMKEVYQNCGFTIYRGKRFLNGEKNIPGDVLVNEGVHTVMFVDFKDARKARNEKYNSNNLLKNLVGGENDLR